MFNKHTWKYASSGVSTCSFSGCLQFYLTLHLITNVSEFSEDLRREVWYLQMNLCQSPFYRPSWKHQWATGEKGGCHPACCKKRRNCSTDLMRACLFFQSKCVTGNLAVHLCKSFAYHLCMSQMAPLCFKKFKMKRETYKKDLIFASPPDLLCTL